MANYNKGIETKQKLVLLTYHKLKKQSASSLTVRRLAKEAGYSPAALYRYFGSLDDLVVVASVRFLEEYISGYATLLDENDDFLTIYIEGWKLFNHYAFDRPDIYYGLYWGDYNGKFGNAVEEYCELFPFLGSRRAPDFFRRLFFSSNIYERDYQVLHEAAVKGLMTEKDAQFFSKTNPLIVKGLLGEYMNQPPECRKAGEEECNALIKENLEHIVPC